MHRMSEFVRNNHRINVMRSSVLLEHSEFDYAILNVHQRQAMIAGCIGLDEGQ